MLSSAVICHYLLRYWAYWSKRPENTEEEKKAVPRAAAGFARQLKICKSPFQLKGYICLIISKSPTMVRRLLNRKLARSKKASWKEWEIQILGSMPQKFHDLKPTVKMLEKNNRLWCLQLRHELTTDKWRNILYRK